MANLIEQAAIAVLTLLLILAVLSLFKELPSTDRAYSLRPVSIHVSQK